MSATLHGRVFIPIAMKYEQISKHTLATDRQEPYAAISCLISNKGSIAVASGIVYNDDGSTSGLGQAFMISGESVTRLRGCVLPCPGCMLVVGGTDGGRVYGWDPGDA